MPRRTRKSTIQNNSFTDQLMTYEPIYSTPVQQAPPIIQDKVESLISLSKDITSSIEKIHLRSKFTFDSLSLVSQNPDMEGFVSFDSLLGEIDSMNDTLKSQVRKLSALCLNI